MTADLTSVAARVDAIEARLRKVPKDYDEHAHHLPCDLGWLLGEYRALAREREQPVSRLCEADRQAIVDMLASLMSGLCQQAHDMRWHPRLEYHLWDIVQGTLSREYGRLVVGQDQIDSLRLLSRLIGGWVARAPHHGPQPPVVAFVPLAEWERAYADYLALVGRDGRAL